MIGKPTIDLLKRTIEMLVTRHPELADDEDFRLDVLEGETDFNEIIHRLIRMSQDNSYLSEAAGEAIKNIRERKARFDRRVDASRELMKQLMEAANIKKLEFATATVYVRDTPASVIVTDEAALPDEFMRIKKEPNLTKIKTALENSHDVSGATLSNGGTSITIRKS